MTEYCAGHQRYHEDHSWKFMDYTNAHNEPMVGWFCHDFFSPSSPHEYVPQRIKDARERYAIDTIQPTRGGVISKEFIQAYPAKAKKMFSQEQIKKSKYVWADVSPTYKKMQK